MFVQVIQGKVKDAEGLRAAMDEWMREQAPQATGWLGTTAGAAEDGTFVAVARFDSVESARRNSDRPEQSDWWARASAQFTGDVTFHDCEEVLTMGGGGSDDAGFVQVIQGRADADRLRAMASESDESLREYRPDVLGATIGLHGDGGFTQVVYFTSEEEAREGERNQPPAEMQAEMAETMGRPEDLAFIDLKSPLLYSPT